MCPAKAPADRNRKSRKLSLTELYQHPGHLFRRAQQIAVAVFYSLLGEEITPIQYAILRTIHDHPGVDQKTLTSLVALDTSSTATTAERLEAKGLIERELHIVGRRQRHLYLTDAGLDLLAALDDGIGRMQEELFKDFSASERQTFIKLMHKFVDVNNERSRAPLDLSSAIGTVSSVPRHPVPRKQPKD